VPNKRKLSLGGFFNQGPVIRASESECHPKPFSVLVPGRLFKPPTIWKGYSLPFFAIYQAVKPFLLILVMGKKKVRKLAQRGFELEPSQCLFRILSFVVSKGNRR